MQGSFKSQAVEQFYGAHDMGTPEFSEGGLFDFSRTAKSTPKPRMGVKKKASKAEQKLAKAENVLEMAEALYQDNPSNENYERVCLAEKLLKYTELAFAEETAAMQEELQYSESYDSMDFTRCVRPDGSSYGSRGKCRKGTPTAEQRDREDENSAIDQLSRMLPKGEKIVSSTGEVTTAKGYDPERKPKTGAAKREARVQELRTSLQEVSDRIDKIVQSGGKVGRNDPLSKQLREIAAELKKTKEG